MTRLDLENAVFRRLNKNTASIDSATQTRIRHFLNQRHRRLLNTPGLTRFRYAEMPFASVIGQSRYAFPNAVTIQRIWEATNDRELSPMTLAEYRASNPDPAANQGTPTHVVFIGYEPVAKHPADASELFVKSSSGSDTVPTVTVEGVLSDGSVIARTVTLTGTTAVSLSAGVTTWRQVTKFYVSAACVGHVTLHEDSGAGTELAKILAGATQARYLVIHLTPQPSEVITYTADYELGSTDFGGDTDEPRIPEQWHALIELGATLDELIKGDDGRYPVVKSEYDEEVRKLEYWLAKQAFVTSDTASRSSRLGPWFPAGS